ncbi:MAG: hypothetical protein E6Q76_02215 [Rhizobium sp.]|nr:MAG: hypothetical protein E6Q76_02215 [Rhizobium sp.]
MASATAIGEAVQIGRVVFELTIKENEIAITCERRGKYRALAYERIKQNQHRGLYETASARDEAPSGDVDSCLVSPGSDYFHPVDTHNYSAANDLSDAIEHQCRNLLADRTAATARQLLSMLAARAAVQTDVVASGQVLSRMRTLVAVEEDLER